MNEIITARDADVIAAEINIIKAQTRKMLVTNAIEIGRRLVEAKSMVAPGRWGEYLERQVDYSQSTAENLMKLFREYGDNQESMFDSFPKSETFGKLSYTQALALLAVPADEREQFAEQNDVASMSTRELQEAIKARDMAKSEKEKICQELDLIKGELEDAVQEIRSIGEESDRNFRKAQETESENARLREKIRQAEKKQADAAVSVEQIKAQLAKAQEQEKTARADLKKAQEHPEIPESLMEQLRKEAEAEAAKNAKADLEKKLAAAQKSVDAAEKARADAEEKLAASQKEAKMSSPDVAVFKTVFNQAVANINQLHGAFMKVKANSPESTENCRRAMEQVSESLRKILAQ